MSAMKRYAERVSEEMGFGGEINSTVLAEARRQMLLMKNDHSKADHALVNEGLLEVLDMADTLTGGICERGHTWLVYEYGRQYFLADLGHERWLEITINPDNYPGFNVHTITGTKEQMVAHIEKEWVGAFARKCNLKGVVLTKDSHVMESGETVLDNH